jgi:hypothetical protein
MSVLTEERTAVVHGEPAICAPSNACPTLVTGVRWFPARSAKPEDVVCELLRAVGAELPEPVRNSAPVLLVASRLSERKVSTFLAQCRDTARRPRPLASVRMETSLTLQRFADRTGWSGAAYALVTPGGDASGSALKWATAGITAGRFPAAYLCEVVPSPGAEDEALAFGFTLRAAGDLAGREIIHD